MSSAVVFVYVYDVYGSPDHPSARNAFIINDADNTRFLDNLQILCRCTADLCACARKLLIDYDVDSLPLLCKTVTSLT